MKELQTLQQEIISKVAEYSALKYADSRIRPGIDVIPPSGKVIGTPELQNMVEASLDGWLTTGRFNTLFEKGLAEFLGVKYCLSVNSGSSANLVAFNTLTSHKLGERAIKKGDEVIGVAAGFPTTVNPIIQFGAVPVFVDVDIQTHNINVDLIEAAITDKTKVIMPVSLFGQPADIDAIKNIAKKCDMFFIIGSRNSSNSVRLVEVAKKSGCENSMLIHSESEIPYDKIQNSNTIGISSGASAPEILSLIHISELTRQAELSYAVF